MYHMRRRNLHSRIVFRSRMIVMIVAVLALFVLNIFDIHAPGIEAHESTVEIVHVDDDASPTKTSPDVNQSHYCHSTTSCHVSLVAAFKVPVWIAAGYRTSATAFDMIRSSSIYGLFRPPKHA